MSRENPETPRAADDAAVPAVGRMLDNYELIAEIARGGMGRVLLGRLARVGGFRRLFAIKLWPSKNHRAAPLRTWRSRLGPR